MKKKNEMTKIQSNLFERVVSILEQARSNVVRSVNSNMVIAYWLIGHEIVEEIQCGEKRAEYGKTVVLDLSEKLNNRYGSGFSVTNLQYFRKFYLVFSDRYIIQHPQGAESGNTTFPVQISRQSGANLKNDFNPDLGWSHYRALMRVKDNNARNFYEMEAAECKWSKTQLERQIQTSYYERILKNKGV